MTVEELLKPRYKVIADYPNSLFEVGDILTKLDGIQVCTNGRKRIDSILISKYPHLFKKLEWWEERNPEEAPEYVKPIKEPTYVFKTLELWGQFIDFLNNDNKIAREYAKAFLPATKEEYEQYKTKVA